MQSQKIDIAKIEQMRRKRIARKRRFMAVIVVIIALVIAYFTGIYGASLALLGDVVDTMYSAINRGAGWPIKHTVANMQAAAPLAGGVAILGETDLTIYSPTGKLLRNMQHGYGNAEISVSNTRVCLYNRSGKELKIESRSRTLHKATYEQSVLLAKMAENGSYAVVTESAGYKTEMAVYNSLFDVVLQWYSAEDMPITLALDRTGKSVAAGCITTFDGGLNSIIYMFKVGEDTPVAEITTQDTIPLKMEYLQNGDLAVVYDSYAAVYSAKDGTQVAWYDFLGKSLQSAEISNKELTLHFAGDVQDAAAQVVLLDKTLTPLATMAINEKVQNITLTRQNIFAVLPQSVITYNLEGTLIAQTPLTSQGFEILDGASTLLVSSDSISEFQIPKLEKE